MLIDASHPEETRVVVVNGNQVEELDFESANKRQLRGNVYLARVTRVEPSLQAAFVEYGRDRHGFLAFSEIHPDYYQIPHEDRVALLEAEEAESLQDEQEAEEGTRAYQVPDSEDGIENGTLEDDTENGETGSENEGESGHDDPDEDGNGEENSDEAADAAEIEHEEEQEKMLGARKRRISRRRYKIQEVVKRSQILLIQAVKEERGNKGAAMTTYLSLAGRYCVLMPNTPRGGGISRKISSGSDRKRLKEIIQNLNVPKGMGVIVRTAGAKRTKVEIKRDFDYLSRLWDTVRKTTLESIAPALIHEEGNLVKRSIRDLYGKEIEQVLVQGEEAYRVAKDFIKMLMPSHARNIQPYKGKIPLFLRYQVEQQIETCLEPVAQLESGGYLVIHPTEALVSVDVNSGRSTKERNVERTALRTNLEATEEIARQMRLRDLAGLIVIDFIDMDEHRNNRTVEKKMREALRHDRARVQMGKISQFGLMEISRQRRRRSLLEGATGSCEHCHGVGRKRSIDSSALKAIRAVEEEGVRGRTKRIRLRVTSEVAAYLINEKRDLIAQIDEQADMFTEIVADPKLIRPALEIERVEKCENADKDPLEEITKEYKESSKNNKKKDKPGKADTSGNEEPRTEGDGKTSSKRRRRRGRRGGRNWRKDLKAETEPAGVGNAETVQSGETIPEEEKKAPAKKTVSSTKEKSKPKTTVSKAKSDDTEKKKPRSQGKADNAESDSIPDEQAAKKADKPKRRSRRKEKDDATEVKPEGKPKAKLRKTPATRKKKESTEKESEKTITANEKPVKPKAAANLDRQDHKSTTELFDDKQEKTDKTDGRQKRRGWWQRRS